MLTSYFNYGGSTRSISPYVKDMYGNELSHKKITIYGSNGGSNTGYTGEYIRLPSGSTVVIKFAGDSKYMPSQFTINFVWGFILIIFFFWRVFKFTLIDAYDFRQKFYKFQKFICLIILKFFIIIIWFFDIFYFHRLFMDIIQLFHIFF